MLDHVLSSDPDRAALKASIHMATAHVIAAASTCRRGRVGAVLLRPDGSVAGTGYNGALPGQPHCSELNCTPAARCLRVRHAERGALDNSGGAPVALAFVTHEPCVRCTVDLIARGCRGVFFAKPYEGDPREATARAFHAYCNRVAWIKMERDDAGSWYVENAFRVAIAGVPWAAAKMFPQAVGDLSSVLQTEWDEPIVVERVDDDHVGVLDAAAVSGLYPRSGHAHERYLPVGQAAAMLRGVL